MVLSNLINICILEKCFWKRRNRNSDYVIRLEDFNIVKVEFGKEEKFYLKFYYFDLRLIFINLSILKEKLR